MNRMLLCVASLATSLALAGTQASAAFVEIGRASLSLSQIGMAGFVVADFDGDGLDDIAFASYSVNPSLVVYGLKSDGTLGFKQLSPQPWQGQIARLLPWKNGGSTHVIALDNTGTVHDFAGWPLVETRTFTVDSNTYLAAIGDVDADGEDDLVLLQDTEIRTYAMSDGHAENVLTLPDAGFFAQYVALAELDADPALEIIVANYGAGLVIDGATGAVDWEYDDTNAFGSKVATGHLDGSGATQWVGDAWGAFNVFGGPPYGLLWSGTTPENIGALATADIDGNGRDVILAGDGQWGSLRVFDPATHQQRFEIPSDTDGIDRAAAADLDGNGVAEIAFAGVSPSDGQTLLTIADSRTGHVAYRYVPANAPMTITAIGDVDGDGHQELVAASYEFTDNATIAIFDLESGAEKWRSPPAIWDGNNPFAIAPATIRIVPHASSPGADIVLAGFATYDGRIEVIDGTTMEEVFRVYDYGTGPLDARPVRDLALYDYDGDGVDDFVVVTDAATTETQGVQLFVFSGVDGSQLWSSSVFDIGARAERVFVIPGTGGGADLVAVDDTHLQAFDAASGNATWTLVATNGGAVYVPRGVAGAEIAVMSEDGALSFYDASTRAYLRGFPLAAPTCDVLPLDGDVGTLAVATGDALVALDGATGAARAVAGTLGQCVSVQTRLAAQAEPGGLHAIAVGTSSALFRERLVLADEIFADSFEPR